MSQAQKAIACLQDDLAVFYVAEVNAEHCKALVSKWRGEGYAPKTIKKRISVLGRMGCKVTGTKIGGYKTHKWWLNPADKDKLDGWLRSMGPDVDHEIFTIVLDYVDWTCHTAIRVEENLRLCWHHVVFYRDPKTGELSPDRMSVHVPGTKTEGSMATIPVSQKAGELLLRRYRRGGDKLMGNRIFPVSYDTLRRYWVKCREHLGAGDQPTATLKSLRRTAARTLHVDNHMPLGLVQQYLRHENLATTIEYLRLTGGFNEDELRGFL